ncbi:MAG: ATP-binding domain-containing protein, partial [Rhodocyclaceae bacterium]|nr:ATP-binding domain-containing protein [Rhodocyclaceae bacterium]
KPGGAVWWMEDPMQNLYGRPALPLPGWVSLHSRTNYRSPHEILRYLNRMLPAAQAIDAGSPLAGFEVEIFTYADHDGLVATTKKALNRAISLGYKRKMIALVSYRGKQESALSGCEQLGNYRLKSFTGKYDLFGSPVYSPGDILFESVYRYKGQSAPCVVLTEIDFDTLDEKALRKLFVGITRATMKLLLVMSDRAAAKLGGYARS